MAIKRVITEKQQNELKTLKRFKDKTVKNLNNRELKELVIIMARKLNIVR